MKKTAIIVILVIMASALFYKYFSKPSSNNLKPISVQTQNTEEGVQLPTEAKKSVSEADLVPTGAQKSVSNADFAYSATCSKNIDSIKEDFSKIWDPGPDKNKMLAINQKDSAKISDMLASYVACTALASRDRSRCDSLPSKKDGGREVFPRERCYYKYDELALSALSAGKYKDDKVCSDYFYSHKFDRSSIKVDTFCLAVKKGVPKICEELKNKIPNKLFKDCLVVFPTSSHKCLDPRNCSYTFELFEAFSSGKIDKCPSQYREHFDAFVNSSESSCNPLRDKLVDTYCEMYSKALKKAAEDAKKQKGWGWQAGRWRKRCRIAS